MIMQQTTSKNFVVVDIWPEKMHIMGWAPKGVTRLRYDRLKCKYSFDICIDCYWVDGHLLVFDCYIGKSSFSLHEMDFTSTI